MFQVTLSKVERMKNLEPCNPPARRPVGRAVGQRTGDIGMSFLKRLFSSKTPEPTQRVRICVECGMPVADHRDWCSIRRGHAEMELRKAREK